MNRLSSWRRRAWLPLLLLSAGTAACSTDPGSGEEADASVDARKTSDGRKDGPAPNDGGTPATCSWSPGGVPELPTNGTFDGSLRGDSRNRSTTCTRQQGTGGPDAVYLLRVRQRSIVSLAMKSEFDSVLAIRKACEDPLTEVACANDPAPVQSPPVPTPGVPNPFPVPSPPSRVDAAVPPQPTSDNPSDASMRVTLDPGNYFVVVDEAAAFGVGGSFQLTVATELPPPNLACDTALPLSGGAVVEEDLDIATTAPEGCGGLPNRPALYYAITLGPGDQLTARASALTGSKPWQPQLALLDGCAAGLCLGIDDASRTTPGERVLKYLNGGTSPKTVLLAVASNVTVSGARFHLETRVAPPTVNVTCEAALPVRDGTTLTEQDSTEATSSPTTACGFFGSRPPLFYSIDLFEGQSVTFTARASNAQSPVGISATGACGSFLCLGSTAGVFNYRNVGPGTQRVILAVSPLDFNVKTFSLEVSAPLPPGSVYVTPTTGLVVDETGKTSQFDVRLGSPPLQPVTVRIESTNTNEVTVSPATLTFTPNDWKTGKTVTVTGVDDATSDGDRSVVVHVLGAESTDARYAGIGATNVYVVNQDDEPGVRVTPRAVATSESGGATTVSARLIRKPTAAVRLPVSSTVPTEATASVTELVFTPTDWADAHTFTVTGVDDASRDGAQAFTIALGALTSDDPRYAGLDPADLPGTNADDEFTAVAQRTISPQGLRCDTTNTTGMRTLAVDGAGTIYVVMSCTDGLMRPPFPVDAAVSSGPLDAGAASGALPGTYIAASRDGGATFTLTRVDNADDAYDFTVAAGRGSNAYAAFATRKTGLVFGYTDDAGASWHASQLRNDVFVNSLRLASAGDVVWLAASGSGGPALWRTEHAGTDAPSLHPFPVLLGGPWDLVWDAQTETLALLHGNDVPLVTRSKDRGDSFDMNGVKLPQSTFGAVWGQSPGSLHAIGFDNQHVTVSVQDPTQVTFVSVPALDKGFRTVVSDDAGVLSVLQQTLTAGMDLIRVATDGKIIERRNLTTQGAGVATGLALSRKAVAYTFWRDGAIQFGIETFP